tara:strand:+ start:228 stop:587 length:360 start_codon:yes stop_codon:yes gene_type:complete
MDYKRKEIEDYFKDFIEDDRQDGYSWVFENMHDLHHHAFNNDYYIIGRYKAKQWLGDEALNVIQFIKEYETLHFGEVSTDFSEPEQIVNMYTYIIGEEVVNDWLEKHYHPVSNTLLINC